MELYGEPAGSFVAGWMGRLNAIRVAHYPVTNSNTVIRLIKNTKLLHIKAENGLIVYFLLE